MSKYVLRCTELHGRHRLPAVRSTGSILYRFFVLGKGAKQNNLDFGGKFIVPYICQRFEGGNSSVVERHLAKVDVAGSSPVSRSFFHCLEYFFV